MDTGFKKIYVDITKLKQGYKGCGSRLQSFEKNLKLEEWRGNRVPG